MKAQKGKVNVSVVPTLFFVPSCLRALVSKLSRFFDDSPFSPYLLLQGFLRQAHQFLELQVGADDPDDLLVRVMDGRGDGDAQEIGEARFVEIGDEDVVHFDARPRTNRGRRGFHSPITCHIHRDIPAG